MAEAGILDVIQHVGQRGEVARPHGGFENSVQFGRHRRLGAVKDFLEQLLARADAGELDLDVDIGPQPGQANHLTRQMDDLDRLAHIEHKNPPAMIFGMVETERRSLQHQLDRLADGHEIGVISGSVTVKGPPAASWRWNSGTTEPVEPSTLPKRTVTKQVEPSDATSSAWQ